MFESRLFSTLGIQHPGKGCQCFDPSLPSLSRREERQKHRRWVVTIAGASEKSCHFMSFLRRIDVEIEPLDANWLQMVSMFAQLFQYFGTRFDILHQKDDSSITHTIWVV